MLEKIHNTTYHRYTRIGFMLMGYAIMLWFCEFKINNYGLKENFSFPVSIAGFVMLGLGVFQTKNSKLQPFVSAALGLLYISLSLGLMLNLYAEEIANSALMKEDRIYMIFFPLFIIGCMWINDTMAYIVGSLIGKTPLSIISPKKTWEGTIGGILLSSVIMGYLAYVHDEWFVFGQSLSFWIFLAVCTTIAGTFGDLLESKLKRMAGVKDSGNIMPGHGGFLDRFDSLLLAIPAVWLYVYLLL